MENRIAYERQNYGIEYDRRAKAFKRYLSPPIVSPRISGSAYGGYRQRLPKIRVIFIPQGGAIGASTCCSPPMPVTPPVISPCCEGGYGGSFSGFPGGLSMGGSMMPCNNFGSGFGGASILGAGFGGGFPAICPITGAPLGGTALSISPAPLFGAMSGALPQAYTQALVPVSQSYPVPVPVPVPVPHPYPLPVPVPHPYPVPNTQTYTISENASIVPPVYVPQPSPSEIASLSIRATSPLPEFGSTPSLSKSARSYTLTASKSSDQTPTPPPNQSGSSPPELASQPPQSSVTKKIRRAEFKDPVV